jgi:hypothetical protein
MRIRHVASIGSIVLGVLLVIGGIATWTVVSSTLADQRIEVPEDGGRFAGQQVRGPFTAYAQAQVIQEHTLDTTEGMTYAELDREDPRREVAMNSSFLQAAMAAGMGVLFVLIGLGMRDVSQVREPEPV